MEHEGTPLVNDPGSNHALIADSPDDIRIGPIIAIPDILAELGVMPKRAFAKVGIDPATFRNPDNRMSLSAAGRLLQVCGDLTKTEHFGLLVGSRFVLGSLGPLGKLMRHSPTVGEALRNLLLHLHLHDKGAAPILLAPTPGYAILGYSIYRHETPALAQIYDASIAIAYRIMVELCGESWAPVCVQFSCEAPADTLPYRQLFQSPVYFDAEVSGVVFASKWLNRPIQGADANVHFSLVKAFSDERSHDTLGFIDQVRIVLPQMVLNGTISSKAIASLFGVSERTLRRRLEEQKVSLQKLLKQARFELARQLLANTRLPVAEIATALHYTDSNIFSRAFHNWAGISPTQWRNRQKPR